MWHTQTSFDSTFSHQALKAAPPSLLYSHSQSVSALILSQSRGAQRCRNSHLSESRYLLRLLIPPSNLDQTNIAGMGGGRRGDKHARAPSSPPPIAMHLNRLPTGVSPTFKVKISQSGRILGQLVATNGGTAKLPEQKRIKTTSSVPPIPPTSDMTSGRGALPPVPSPNTTSIAAKLLPRVGSVKANGKAPASAVSRGGKGASSIPVIKKKGPRPLRPVMVSDLRQCMLESDELTDSERKRA